MLLTYMYMKSEHTFLRTHKHTHAYRRRGRGWWPGGRKYGEVTWGSVT